MATTSYFDLNSLATLPTSGGGPQPIDFFTPSQQWVPYQPSVIDQRWPMPSEQFQPPPPPPTFNQRWPGLHEQFQNMDYPLFEGPGETDQDFFRTQVASLSGPRFEPGGVETFTPAAPPGGVINLGRDHLPSPFAPSGVQDFSPHSFSDPRIGPYGGTDPRFFGGGIDMSYVGNNFPRPDEQFIGYNPIPQSDPGRFDYAFSQFDSGPSYEQWTMMPGDGGFVDRISSQAPQTALFSNYDPTPSVYDNSSWLASSGITSSPSSYGLYTSGPTPSWATIAPGPAPLYTGPTIQPYGGVGPLYGGY